MPVYSKILPRGWSVALYRASILEFLRSRHVDEIEVRLFAGSSRPGAIATCRADGCRADEVAHMLALFIAVQGQTAAQVIGRTGQPGMRNSGTHSIVAGPAAGRVRCGDASEELSGLAHDG